MPVYFFGQKGLLLCFFYIIFNVLRRFWFILLRGYHFFIFSQVENSTPKKSLFRWESGGVESLKIVLSLKITCFGRCCYSRGHFLSFLNLQKFTMFCSSVYCNFTFFNFQIIIFLLIFRYLLYRTSSKSIKHTKQIKNILCKHKICL